MPLNRTYIIATLIARLGGWWALVGFPIAPADTTNTSFDDCLAVSGRLLPLQLLDFTTLTDADLTAVTAGQLDQLVDVAEWRAVRTIRANWSQVSQSVNNEKQDLNDIAARVEKADLRLTDFVKDVYGIGLGTIVPGTVDLDFQSEDDPLSLTQIFS